ncbi:unnamed protein product [Dicrocoelium dendriticum]|nr:unnamed protein product [Dicrocoelium dendriticum]
MRRSRDTYWNEQSGLYVPPDMNVDKVARSPVLMELRRDLVPANGPDGLYGICILIFRVLDDTHLPPAEECRRYHNSRQSVLGDITEFYHSSVQHRQTTEFEQQKRNTHRKVYFSRLLSSMSPSRLEPTL